MHHFSKFLSSLGAIHDGEVLSIDFDSFRGQLVLKIDDIYSNFEGLPEYPGSTPATVFLSGVEMVTLVIESKIRNLRIHDFEIVRETIEGGSGVITFWPEGSIRFKYVDVIVKSGESLIWPTQ